MFFTQGVAALVIRAGICSEDHTNFFHGGGQV